jgi:two-component system NtrC family sensor kinase
LGKVSGEVDFCPAMVRYSVPIRDEIETLQGVLVVNMWGKRFDDALEAALGGYPGKVYMAEINRDPDRDGIYLYHRNADMRFSNQANTNYRFSNAIDSGLWEQITAGEPRGFVVNSDNRMFFYKKFTPFSDRENQWLLLIETKRETILAPITSLRDWIIYLIIAVLVISLIVAKWAASRLARPVNELAQIITKYADGDHSAHYDGERSDEIGRAGKAFNYLSESLEKAELERDKAEQAVRQSERLAAVGQMAAGIGHEINNPLMNIMSLASLIEESVPKDNNQVHDDISALQNEGKRCARIVQGILNFARETEPQYQQFELGALINETLSVFQHRLQVMSVHLDVDVQDELVIRADYGQLQQVLMNIIINAMHASPEGSTISIHADRKGDNAVIEVLDNGAGIRTEDMPRVFSPFFTTKPEGSGTGLGLSVSYGIIKKHGGTVTLENRKSGGVRVVITLPINGVTDVINEDVSSEVRNAG